MIEEWKDVTGYEGYYMVSSFGRLKILPKRKPNKRNRVLCIERISKPTLRPDGYLYVGLRMNNKRDNFLLHRLIAIAFLEKPEGKDFVNHKNCNKQDNRLENLEWCTGSENMKHAANNGLIKLSGDLGEKHHSSKLKEADVLKIRELHYAGISASELGRRYSVSSNSIDKIIHRKSWKKI